MKVKQKGTWREVADSARTTVGMDAGTKEPSFSWKRRMLLTEHSPIRKLVFCWKWKGIPYWVSVHLVRHWLGIVHFVKTSRTDRTGVAREKLPQDNPVDHECEANAQALINISRKRLCSKASKETTRAWREVVESIDDPAVQASCVPECIYRGGHCFEKPSCRWITSREGKSSLAIYLDGVESASAYREGVLQVSEKYPKGDCRDHGEQLSYAPTTMEFVVENKKGFTRHEMRKIKALSGAKNTRGLPLGYNKKTWQEYCNTREKE